MSDEADRPQSPDWLSRAGAEALKLRIESYWSNQGAVVEVRIVPLPRGGFGLASDLRQGLPARTT
jgi:hypothetical protein